MDHDMIIRNASLRDREGLYFICVQEGYIDEIDKMENFQATDGTQLIDAEGGLVLPPFIDSHIHYDSAFIAGEPRWNQSGTLIEAIECLNERKSIATYEDYEKRMVQLIQWQAAQGVQFTRVHADVSGADLTALEVILDLREKMKDWMTIQVVAFPQMGMMSEKGQFELMEEAMRLGADGIGGIPQLEMTRELGVESVRKSFDLAEKYDRFVDIHCDETDDDHSRFIEVMAAEAIFRDFGERTTASHATAMHSYNNAYAAKLIGLLLRAEMNIVSNPLSNIALQGRYDTFPVRRGLTRIKPLLEAGINVSLGHDNFIDPFYSLGTADMLTVLNMGIHVSHMLTYKEINQALDLITVNAAQTLGVNENTYGIEKGKPANFVIMDASNAYECIRTQAVVRYSVRGGKILAESPSRTTKLFDPRNGEEVRVHLEERDIKEL